MLMILALITECNNRHNFDDKSCRLTSKSDDMLIKINIHVISDKPFFLLC